MSNDSFELPPPINDEFANPFCRQPQIVPASSKKWTETITPNQIITTLEKLVLYSPADKSYNKAASEGISSSKRTLESLLARNGGQQNCMSSENAEIAYINKKNYTLDANGRVCLVKNADQQKSRNQEMALLQKETRELRSLQKNVLNSLEVVMQDHRKMMTGFVDDEKNRKRNDEQFENAKRRGKALMMAEFAMVAKGLDMVLAKEELKSERRRKLLPKIELETFLMQTMLNMDDILEITPERLVEKWRNHQKTMTTSSYVEKSKPATISPTNPNFQATGDHH